MDVGGAKLVVERELCVGAGQCVLVAPEVFEQDDLDGRVVLLDPVPPEAADDPAVQEAVLRCPAGALSLSLGIGIG